MVTEQPDLAISDCNKLIEIDPKNAYNHYICRGMLHNSKGQYNKAIFDYNKAIEIDPTVADAYGFKALVCENTGRISEANEAWEKMMRYHKERSNPGDVTENYNNTKVENKRSAVRLPKTGQTISYATGDDGDLERGIAWPSPRFIDNGDGTTVTDNFTGLMWTKNALLAGANNWQDALTYVAGMNAGTYQNFGYTDWRLPNRKELRSMTDYSKFNPAIPSPNLFICVVGDYYWWSSSTYADDTDNARVVSRGSVYADYKSSSHYVWPVRAGQ